MCGHVRAVREQTQMGNSSFAHSSPIGDYSFSHIAIGTAVATGVPVGILSATTATGSASTGVQTLTPVSMANIKPGTWLNVAGTGTAETVQVLSTSATTFTADFKFAHNGSVNLSTANQTTYLGPIVVNTTETIATYTLYNGHPSANPAGQPIAVLTKPTLGANLPFSGKCDQGLYYTISGGTTTGSLTIHYLDRPAAGVVSF